MDANPERPEKPEPSKRGCLKQLCATTILKTPMRKKFREGAATAAEADLSVRCKMLHQGQRWSCIQKLKALQALGLTWPFAHRV